MYSSLNDYYMATSGEDLPEIEYCAGCDAPLLDGVCMNPECPECPEFIEEMGGDA